MFIFFASSVTSGRVLTRSLSPIISGSASSETKMLPVTYTGEVNNILISSRTRGQTPMKRFFFLVKSADIREQSSYHPVSLSRFHKHPQSTACLTCITFPPRGQSLAVKRHPPLEPNLLRNIDFLAQTPSCFKTCLFSTPKLSGR